MVTGVVLETPVAMVILVYTVKIAAAFKVDVVINVEDTTTTTTTTTGPDGGAVLVVVGIEGGMREDMPKHTGVPSFRFKTIQVVLDTCEVILGQRQIV